MLFLNVWFDWNRNGDWDDVLQLRRRRQRQEWAVQNQPVPFESGLQQFTTLPFLPWHPTSTNPIPVWVRMTLSEQPWQPWGPGGSGPPLGYDYGETEDYYVTEYSLGEREFGDAPEGSAALAYPPSLTTGAFPTCKVNGPSMWVQHNNFGAYFGPAFDLEADGNAGLCQSSSCFPPYDADECYRDGDAGLIIPEPFTIDPRPPDHTVPPVDRHRVGVRVPDRVLGGNVDIDVTNNMPSNTVGRVNLLVDWNQDGQWGGIVTCPGPALRCRSTSW